MTNHDIRVIPLTEEHVSTLAKVMGVAEASLEVVLAEDNKHHRVRFFNIEYIDDVPTKLWLARPGL